MYIRSNQTWSTTATQTLTNADSKFGSSLALDSNVLVVGDPINNSAKGIAYIYTFNSNSQLFTLNSSITASDSANTKNFGYSVAINNGTIVIGENNSTASNDEVYVFNVNTAGIWLINANDINGAYGNQYGASVAIDDNIIVIGAPKTTTYTGAAYVYINQSGTWTLAQSLTSLDTLATSSNFGISVSISGKYIAVGASGTGATISGSTNGVCYLFQQNNNTWSQCAKIYQTPPYVVNNAQFGLSVAINANHLLIGAATSY